MTVLAIDQGTTSTKAFLLHPDGRFESVGHRRHQQHLPGDGLVEHDAAGILAGIEALIAQALAQCPAIGAIGLANQGETVVAWDRQTGQPLHRAIVWQDQRTQGRLDRIGPRERARVTELSGLPLDAYFSASKLAWLLDQVPEGRALAATGRLGLATSDAFFLERLTGAYVTDPTTASRTSLLAIRDAGWSAELAGIFGVPLELLPAIVPTAGPIAVLERGGRRIPVTASAVDQQAALYGHGCRAAGDMKITFGTGTFALALTGVMPAGATGGLVPTIAWQLGSAPPDYALEGGDYTAAAAVEWAISIGLAGSIEAFELPAGSSALERGLVFVPALEGLAAPHWNRAAAGAFLGLRQSTTAADMRRAVLEGIALRAVELVEALTVGAGKAISIDGGLTRNRGFVQFLADVLGQPVIVTDHAELTALGIAELAYVGLGQPVPPRSGTGTTRIEPTATSARIRALRPQLATAIAAVQSWAARS